MTRGSATVARAAHNREVAGSTPAPATKLSEKQFQAQVVQLARYQGWLVYHTYDSRRSADGFPDLVLVRPPTVLFVELKTEKGVTSMAQEEWLTVLGDCSQAETALWRPGSWDEIERTLKKP